MHERHLDPLIEQLARHLPRVVQGPDLRRTEAGPGGEADQGASGIDPVTLE